MPHLGKVALCRRCPIWPNTILPFGHHSYMLQRCPLCGLHGLFYCDGEDYCGHSGRWDSLAQLLARLCLLSWLPICLVVGQQAMELEGLKLVPTCWWGGKLERGHQNGTCQYQCPCGRRSFPKWLPPASMAQRESQFPPASLGGSLRSANGYKPSTFQSTASAL